MLDVIFLVSKSFYCISLGVQYWASYFNPRLSCLISKMVKKQYLCHRVLGGLNDTVCAKFLVHRPPYITAVVKMYL